MEKAMQRTGLYLFMIIAILFLTPLMDSCTASSAGEKLSDPQRRSKTEAVEKNGESNSFESDCVRGEPEPVLRNSKFKLLTPFSAVEEYALSKNIKLTIQHSGCAHFSQSFHFKIKTHAEMKNDWRSWMNFAVDQLRLLPVQEVDKAQIKDMIRTLKDQAMNAPSYLYNTEIPVSEAEFLSFDVKRAGGNSVEIIVLYQFIL